MEYKDRVLTFLKDQYLLNYKCYKDDKIAQRCKKEKKMINKKVIVRAERAGVFYGELKESDRINKVVVLKNARRLHYWNGVQGGTTGLACCKQLDLNKQQFSDYVDEVEIQNVLEINKCSESAIKLIEEVAVWKI